LIVNEAVTNAYKHAYPDGKSGVIRAQLLRRDKAVSLRIADDGIGLTGTRNGSLGLRLIHDFAQQLSATLSMEGKDGTSLTLTVPLAGDLPGGKCQ
jgi:two-component sensor histidine kinase